MKRITLFLALATLFLANIHAQQHARVAAAANLRYVLEEIKKQYESEHSGSEIEIIFGSSGTLTKQILDNAPFDFFMAADTDYPKEIVKKGFAKAGEDATTYAYGKLALWSLNLDVSGGLKSVLLPEAKKIAIANPKTAPYGESAVELLKNQGLYNKISHKIVWGDNISQAAQFAFSGNAELGFIALSLAFAPEMQNKGHFYVFPERLCPSQEQGCVLIKNSNEEAAKFKDYIMSPKCDNLWIKFGYGLVKR